MKSDDDSAKPGALIETTVGRVLFNTMLPDGMPFYNIPLRSSDLASVISDCYEILGRRATIDLLDDMNRIGFRQSTRSGLSFATDDLITPPNKSQIIADAEKERAQDARSSTSAASSPRASATTRCSTPGRTPASRSPPK